MPTATRPVRLSEQLPAILPPLLALAATLAVYLAYDDRAEMSKVADVR